MSELSHHGVKGQKWGVRRYQNKDGSLTAKGKRKLAAYKKRELKKLDSRYDIGELDRKRTKLEDKYGSSRDPKKQQKITEARYKQHKAEVMKFLESKAVRNMTFKDMDAEKTAVGKARVANYLVDGLQAAFISVMTGRPHIAISHTPSDDIKTEKRVSANTRLAVDREIRKVTGHTGRWHY